MLYSASVRKSKAAKEHGLIWIPCHSLNLELLPIFSLGANLQCLYNFSTKFGKG